MATEFLIKLKDRPGQLAALTAALGDAGVNVRGIGGNKGVVGIVVSDNDTAKLRLTPSAANINRQMIAACTTATSTIAQRNARGDHGRWSCSGWGLSIQASQAYAIATSTCATMTSPSIRQV